MTHPLPFDPSRRRWLQAGAGALAGTALLSRLASARAQATAATASAAAPLRLDLNESSYGPSPRVAEAIRAAVAQAPRYVEEAQAQALRAQIAAFESVAPEQVVLGEVLEALGQHLAIAHGGGRFVYSTPGYGALVDAAAPFGGKAVEVPLDAKLENDLPALAAAVDADTRAVFVVNPHNPSGTVSAPAAFDAFVREVSRRTLLIVDEAYLDYLDDFRERTAVRHLREGANIVVFRTFGKIHALAGLQIGYAVAPRALADALHARGVGGAHAQNQLSIAAASASLADTAHVAAVRRQVAAERVRWLHFLDGLKRPYAQPAGNFVFFDSGRPHARFAEALKAQGVRIGRAFPPYADWARITIGTSEENARAQRAIAAVLA
ncbi:MAG: histidinol-phosphate transaminase [Pseudoxanthomonas sp.]